MLRGRSAIRSRIAWVSPLATRWPLTSTSTRGAIRSTSWRTWEETTTVRPSSPRRMTRSTMCRRCAGSRPLRGSSSSSSSGSCASAWASFTRWRMPWEKPRSFRSATSPSAHLVQRPARRRVGVAHAAQARAEGDHRPRGQEGPQRVAVVGDADAPVGVEVARQVGAQHPHRPRAGLGEARAELQRGRLAGAVVAQQPGDARPERERDVRERHGVAVPARDLLEDQRLAVHASAPGR